MPGGQSAGGVPIPPWQTQPDKSTQLGRKSRGKSQQKPSQQGQGFQKMTVQPQLDACMSMMRQELWEEVRVLRTFLAREIQLAQQVGLRPSF